MNDTFLRSNSKRSLIRCEIEQKKCIFCNQFINSDDFSEHVVDCTGSVNTPPVLSIQKSIGDETDSCYTSENILQDDYSERATNDIEFENNLPETQTSDDEINAADNLTDVNVLLPSIEPPEIYNDDDDDVYATPGRMSPVTFDENPKKFCVLCQSMINESEFIDHMMCCSGTSPIIQTTNDESYVSRYSKDNDEDQVKDCIICYKPIKESEYVQHVHTCLSEATTAETMKKQTITCFSCHRSIDLEDHLSREMSCPSRHIYCLTCLQYSMEKFARTRSIPLCHLTLCDYELSRCDIAFIPLERRISDRLFQLAKGQQRPQCSKCYFYIDVNEIEDFYDHIDGCDGDLVPCKYCFCPYSIDQLEDHTVQCRNDKSSQNDKLVYFIMKRTKYPFTKEQIQIFIQQKKKKDSGDLDPLTVVNALAVFGSIFPCDMPTKVCDVCMEACFYEDIYVFDCPDSHKLCYQCYYQSCATKMSNGELLTCGLCTHLLQDGELNQIRASDEERRKIRDYQMKKTLDDYSNHTCGIIKCPNQSCSWLAEAEDPTQRFKVQCRLCKSEFCSLCNQQYHYRTTCQQLPQITQQWYLWCETERNRYLTIRAREDEDYAERLNDYNRQMNENEKRNGDLRRRYEELMRDEEYKTKNCRLCPSCKRVVQRLEGCDTMICGQDAHGGNIQSGCGTKFNWTKAQPYTATNEFQTQQSAIDLPKPEHPIVEHIGVQCDQCQNDVAGIRFDCVHCPTLTYCEKCEQQSTLNHSQENERMKQQSHVFRLIMTPEEVSS